MTKIAFLWDWQNDDYQTLTWRDGLAAALRELGKRGYDVKVFTCGQTDYELHHPYGNVTVAADPVKQIQRFEPGVILYWGDFTRPNAEPLQKLGVPMAICFAGGEAPHYTTPYFDHIFVESQVYADKLKEKGYDNVSVAFGTNTDLYKPLANQPKVFDTIFPATFAAWKRHDLYAKATTGLNSLAVGYMYDNHETECWQVCLDNEVMVLPHVSAETMHRLYAGSKVCVVPSRSDGGSQRTVLEAMAMNLPLVVTDSDKFDYVKGFAFEVEPTVEAVRGTVRALLDGEHEVNSRQYVLDNWSEFTYADKLEAGLLSLLKA